MKLSYDDVKRYIAHINLKKIGSFGQKKIIDTKILIVGIGGLGSPVATYLASTGASNIGIVDHDKIDISNLQRQILFNEKDVNKFKVDIAEKKLKKINSKIKIKKFKTKIDSNNINKIAKQYDLIIDGTDSFKTKLLINDYCYKNKKILICGAISKFDGHVFVFNFKKKNSPCLRCFMPDIPSADMLDCQSEGVLSTLAGMVGIIMTNETIREILNFENSLCGNILIINAENLLIKKIKLKKNKNCIKKIK
ncbi:MAG: HesA/MoeB/ThiF family protein [Candidatus Fonsibacter sp.]